MTKACTNKNCTQVNPQHISNFYNRKISKDGLFPRCKTCILIYRTENKEFLSLSSREYRKKNIVKIALTAKQKRDKHKELYRFSNLRRYWPGKNLHEIKKLYEDLMVQQNNVCAICLNPEMKISKITNDKKNLSVDHCHSTGKVRGLLCHYCNSILGLGRESPDILNKAIEYLKKHKGSND